METTKPRPFVFVLMPFDPRFQDAYEVAVKDACQSAGAYCERLDEQQFEERMLDRIYNQIAKADLVLADMTGRNPNVFYEVGYAHALGKRVILISQEVEDIPFDLKDRRHIKYDSGHIGKLRDDLVKEVGWHVANPTHGALTQNANLGFYIHGKKLEPGRCYPVTTGSCLANLVSPSSRPLPFQIIDTFLAVPIAAHNSADTSFEAASFGLLLFAPPVFRTCERYLQGKREAYAAISIPDGRLAYKPPGGVSLEPGGWERVDFNLFPRKRCEAGDVFEFTLRVVSAGPYTDIPFSVQIQAETAGAADAGRQGGKEEPAQDGSEAQC